MDGHPETDVMDQFLDPETDIMGERNYISKCNKEKVKSHPGVRILPDKNRQMRQNKIMWQGYKTLFHGKLEFSLEELSMEEKEFDIKSK